MKTLKSTKKRLLSIGFIIFILAVCFLPNVSAEDSQFSVSQLIGEVQVKSHGDSSWETLSRETNLSVNTTIKTGDRSSVLFKSDDGKSFLVPENKTVKIKDLVKKKKNKEFIFISLNNAEGRVQIQRSNTNEWQIAKAGEQLYSNDKIRTLLASSAELEYPDGTSLTLRENSILTIKDISQDSKSGVKKRELKLDLGGMKYKVTRIEEKGSEFKIHSSTAIVGVTGTEGIITTEGEGKATKNILLEGSTYNTDENGLNGRPLASGNTWTIDEDAKTDKHVITNKEKDQAHYTQEDTQTIERFNGFIRQVNIKKNEGYIVDTAVLDEITQAIISREYARANELLENSEKLLSKLKKPRDPKATKVTQALSEIRASIEEKKQNYDLKNIYILVYNAQEAYKQEKFDLALDLTNQIKQRLLTLSEGKDDFAERLAQLMDRINSRARAGFIVDETVEITKRAQIAYQNGNHAESEELLKKASTMLVQTKRKIPSELKNTLSALKEDILAKEKEGFDVVELDSLLFAANSAFEEDRYLEAQKITLQIKEKLKSAKKDLSKELVYLLKTFEDNLKKKIDAGFDLSNLQDKIKTIYEAKETGDFEKLKTLLVQTNETLSNLKSPQGLLSRIKDFRDELEAKKKSNYLVNDIERLDNQIQLALDKQNINQARLILNKAQTLLKSLKDTEPPTIQASDLVYKDNSVIVSGIIKDNVKVDYVTVNGSLANLSKEGRFEKELLMEPSLTTIIINGWDLEANAAPQINISIPKEKISKGAITPPGKLNKNDVKLTYTKDGILIKGKTAPGATIKVGDLNVIADSKGEFESRIKGSPELVKNGIELSIADSASIALKIEDKWKPQLEIKEVKLFDNMPPTLKVDNLSYKDNKIILTGNCVDITNVTISGSVKDIGDGGLKELTVNGQKASLPKGGKFKHTLLLSPELKKFEIRVLDLAGNESSILRALDLFLAPAVVSVNEKDVSLDASGHFLTELYTGSDLKEVVVKAKDSLGNETTPVKLIVADRISPSILVGDILYQSDKVTITGQSEPYAMVYDKDKVLFQNEISTDASGAFSIELERPKKNISGKVVAQDASGNLSEEIPLTIEALTDKKPPKLTVANLDFQKDKVIVKGKAEDDTIVKEVKINNKIAVLVDGLFYEELALSDELIKIEIVATDISGKSTTVYKVVTDSEKPSIAIDDLKFEKGFCIVSGQAKDNLGIREVRINNVPVHVDGGKFTYNVPVTAGLKKVVASCVDLYGNYSETPAKELVLPDDKVPPELNLNELSYGSPRVTISGVVTDNIGLKAVYVNGIPINVYEDGSFKVEVDIEVGEPEIILNDPIYSDGFVIISGQVNPPTQDPSEIVVTTEDISGNTSVLMKREVNCLNLDEFKVLVNGQPTDLQNGSFRTEVLLETGMSDVPVQVIDSLGNTSDEVLAALEKVPPVLNLDGLSYGTDTVTVSGTATDSGSGLLEILINGSSSGFDGQGKFSQTLTIAESTVTVIAYDRLGNTATSSSLEVTIPDNDPPLFVLNVNPVPAIAGQDISVSIDVLDSETRLPEILPQPPVLNSTFSNGEVKETSISGAGASFNGTISTTGLPTGLVSLAITGTDEAGNTGTTIEGLDSFLLNETDSSTPSFTINLNPPPPVTSGKDITVEVTASETLQSLPTASASLPGGVNFEFTLDGPLSGTSFKGNVAIPSGTPPGNGTIELQGAVDLAGNPQGSPTIYSFSVVPERLTTELPLQIEFSEITTERLLIRGSTTASAIVHISLADLTADIPANENGLFSFQKEISAADLEKWGQLGSFILLNCYATNYAGLISETISLNIPLPEIIPDLLTGETFTIVASPDPLQQGELAQFTITSAERLSTPPKALIRLSDGKLQRIILTGANKEFKGVYQSDLATAIGPAIIEVMANGYFGSRPYRIVPSAETYALIAGADFFTTTASPDPVPQGETSEILINTQRPIRELPTLDIVLPDGKTENIPVAGEGSEFRGRFVCGENAPLGPAELIVNMGKPNESRRPFGIVGPEGLTFGGLITSSDIFAFSNPMPMFAGKPATITVKSAEELDEVPLTEIRLSNGRILPVNISGSTPGTIFKGRINLPRRVILGPATIVVKDRDGIIIGEYPTGIAPPFGGKEQEVEAFMVPSPAAADQTVTIDVNSKMGPLDNVPQAKLIFSDGIILPFDLEGSVPSETFRATVTIPTTAASGPVSIVIMDETGKTIGGGQGYISDSEDAVGAGGELRITSQPPIPIPGQPFEISIYSEDTILETPNVTLDIPGKRMKTLRVSGEVPGNSFTASTTFPRRDMVMGSRIEVRFDTGQGEQIQYLYFEAGPSGGGGIRPPELNPFPPIPGQPLIITLYAPEIVYDLPGVQVNYTEGSESVIMSGAIPGDTFSGTLPKVKMPITSIDVLDENGNLIISLPLEVFGLSAGAPRIDIMPQPLMPGVTSNMNLNFTSSVFSTPTAEIKLNDGRVIPIILNGIVPGSNFTGMFTIPNGTPYGPAILEVYMDNQPIEGGSMPIYIGEDTGIIGGDPLALMVFLRNMGELELNWHPLPNAVHYRILCEAQGGTDKKTFDVTGRVDRHLVDGLSPGIDYRVLLIAFDDARAEITRSERFIRVPGLDEGFPLYVNPAGGDSLQISWDPQPGAVSYDLMYALEPMDPLAAAPITLGNVTGYFLSGLAPGDYKIVVEAILSNGERIKSQEVPAHLGSADYGRPPIELHPPIPVMNEPLGIDVMLPMVIPVIPRITVRYETQGEEPFMVTGSVPGSHFMGQLPSVRDRITHINFYDPMTGELRHSQPLSGMMPSGGIPHDLHVQISVYPETAAVGTDVIINLGFNQPIDFNGAGLRLTVEFLGGRELEIPVSGSGPEVNYSAVLPASEHTNPVNVIGVANHNIVPDEYINTQVTGGVKAEIFANPDPPRVGFSTQINVEILDANTNQPSSISSYPEISAEFSNGEIRQLPVSGALPGSYFTANITASDFYSPLKLVDVDYNGALIGSRSFADGGGGAGPMYGPRFSPDPPITGQSLNLILDIPPEDTPLMGLPLVRINYDSSVNIASETMSVTGTVPGWHFEGNLPMVQGPVVSADFINPTTNEVVYTHTFGVYGPPTTGWVFNLSPMPPGMGQPLYVNLVNNTGAMISSLPYLRLHYENGNIEEYLMNGSIPGSDFYYNIPYLLNPLEKVTAWDNNLSLKLAEIYTDSGPMGPPQILESVPSPLTPGTYTEFPVEFANMVDFQPVIMAVFDDGTELTLDVTGALPGQYFAGRLYAANFIYTGSLKIVVEDDLGFVLAERTFYLEAQPYPTNVWDEATGIDTERKIHWDTVPGVAGYDIYVGPNNPPTTKWFEVFSNVGSEVITGLLEGQTYYYYVTVQGDTAYEGVNSFISGGGTSGGGNLNLVSPTLGSDGKADISFNDTNQGTTTNTITITIQNIGNTDANVVRRMGFLENITDHNYYIASSQINFPSSFTVTAGSSVSNDISLSIPSSITSGNYVTPPGSEMMLFHDVNNNNLHDSGEPFILFRMMVYVGTFVEGLDIAQGGVNFGSVAAGSNSSIQTVNVENTVSYNLTNIQVVVPTLYGSGGGNSINSSNVFFDLKSSVAGALGAGEITSSEIYVSVPAGQPNGEYGGILSIYNDANTNGSRDNDEPQVNLPMVIDVTGGGGGGTSTTVGNLSVLDHGTGGIVDVSWTDSDSGNHYHVYYDTVSGSQSFGSPQLATTSRAVQISSLTDNTAYYFVVRNSPGTSHTANDNEDSNTTEVSVTPTTSGTDVTPPTFSGIYRGYANGISGQVVIEFDTASDASTPITYYVYASTSLNNLYDNWYGPVTSPYTITGLTDGSSYYLAARAKDNVGNKEKNTKIDTATPYSSVDHITITSDPSGVTGTPVLVQLASYSSTDDSTPNTSFSDTVKVVKSVSGGNATLDKFILSVQDRVTDEIADVQMENGLGHFTVDAIETGTVSLNVDGISSNAKQITFTGSSGTTTTQFAVDSDGAGKTGNTTTDGVLIAVSAIDSSGKVDTAYTGTITISHNDPSSSSTILTLEDGDGNLVGNQYTYAGTDNGEVVFRLQDTEVETVTSFGVTAPYGSNQRDVTFSGVEKFLLESAGQYTINTTTVGNRIKFIAYAATNSGTKLGGYDGQATWNRVSETISNSSSQGVPSSIPFTDGVAEFYVEDSEYETVTFTITDGGISSGNINATFTSSDATAPDVRSAEAETPYLIRIKFTEVVDSDNALNTSNYTGVGTINKICWYEDEVTLHLASPLALGSNQSVTINGISPDGIKDQDGNYMGNKNPSFTVPNVDYQGSSYGSGDWLEIQVTPSSVPWGSLQGIKAIIKQKNACGYLSGSNAVNKGTEVSSININYTGNTEALSNHPSSQSFDDGQCEFTFDVNFGSSVDSVQVEVTAGSVTSGQATVSAQ